jgi:tetratricopeptide (TPR) repeat protein
MKYAILGIAMLGMSGALAAGEPTISEMIVEAKAMSVKPDKTGRVNPNQTIKDSLFVQKMKRGVEVELGKRDHEYKRTHNFRNRARLWYEIGRYKQALGHMLQACRNERDGHTVIGLNHMSLARTYMMMGQGELAKAAYEEASKRVVDEHRLRDLKRLKDWMENFEKSKTEAEKLETKAAQDPKDAKSRWRLVELYDRAYPRRLDRFVLLMKFKELYPEHKRVKRGDCDWELTDALWHFGLRTEAMERAKKHLVTYAKHRRTTYGDAMLRVGRWHHELGQYASALRCYLEVQDKYPKHWSNRRNKVTGFTWLGGRIISAKKALRGGR